MRLEHYLAKSGAKEASLATSPEDVEGEGYALSTEEYLSIDRQRVDIEAQQQRNADIKHSRGLREKYANRAFCYLVGYSVLVAATVLMSGFNFYGFTLHHDVLKYLVGSTAAAAIGLVYAVTNGLFKGMGSK